MYVVNTVAVNTHTPGFPLITQRNSQRRACWWFPSKLDASLARILPACLPLVLLLFFFAPSPSPPLRQIASAGCLLTFMTTLSIQNPFPTALIACLLTLLASPFSPLPSPSPTPSLPSNLPTLSSPGRNPCRLCSLIALVLHPHPPLTNNNRDVDSTLAKRPPSSQ